MPDNGEGPFYPIPKELQSVCDRRGCQLLPYYRRKRITRRHSLKEPWKSNMDLCMDHAAKVIGIQAGDIRCIAQRLCSGSPDHLIDGKPLCFAHADEYIRIAVLNWRPNA